MSTDVAGMPPVLEKEPDELPAFAQSGINLASAGLGAEILSVSDEFFAPAPRMLDDAPAIFYPTKFDDHGKWMDGWETRRRRSTGNDWAILKLAVPGWIGGFDIDTAHFTGNYAPACKIDACICAPGEEPGPDSRWFEILPAQTLGPDAHHFFACAREEIWSHLRVQIFPDGGIARLRAYGRPELPKAAQQGESFDLASALAGARIVAMSDSHYGDYRRLLAPGRAESMADGWETRRRREPGYDWMIIRLAAQATIESVLVDTGKFKGNFPDSCWIQAGQLSEFSSTLREAVVSSSMFWPELLPQSYLTADAEHEFTELKDVGAVTHVRLNIHPDGGVSRLRVRGKMA